MELIYKCQLINRKKRPIELTKEGQLLYVTSRDILDRYDQFKSELNSMKSSSSSRINIAAIFSVGMHVCVYREFVSACDSNSTVE